MNNEDRILEMLAELKTEMNKGFAELKSEVAEGFKTSDAMIVIMDKKIDGLAERVDANTEAIKNLAYENLLYRRRA